jgi:hypothetical protein
MIVMEQQSTWQEIRDTVCYRVFNALSWYIGNHAKLHEYGVDDLMLEVPDVATDHGLAHWCVMLHVAALVFRRYCPNAGSRCVPCPMIMWRLPPPAQHVSEDGPWGLLF